MYSFYNWFLLIAVYGAEHLLLTRRYGMTSSLQKLLRQSASARTDLPFAILYDQGFRLLGNVPKIICGPGWLYLLSGWTLSHATWPGLVTPLLPSNALLVSLVMLVALDLPLYVTHRLLHAVPSLWRIHMLHHAATEMNIANGSRVALSEYFLGEAAILLFMFVLFGSVKPEIALGVIMVRGAVDMIQHSDLPWDYGVFGRVVASPSFHRLHHSIDQRDHNRNFANMFSVWDHIFGTASARYVEDSSVAFSCPIGLDPIGLDPIGLDRSVDGDSLNGGVKNLFHGTLPAWLWARIAELPRLRRQTSLPGEAEPLDGRDRVV